MKGLLPMYKGYQAKVEFSVEDSLLVGEVIGVADYLSFHAESVREVEDMFHQCIDGYLAFCREAGKTPEKAYRGLQCPHYAGAPQEGGRRSGRAGDIAQPARRQSTGTRDQRGFYNHRLFPAPAKIYFTFCR